MAALVAGFGKAMSAVNSRAMRCPEIDVSGKHSPAHVIDDFEDAEATAIGRLVEFCT